MLVERDDGPEQKTMMMINDDEGKKKGRQMTL
jgi:hypothetical protein